ncbi:hypothetical protein IE81DRAFT_345480 [Ceraceosorus guamensis]|uniref:Uncharacterized protein n=1 Tax=Ceraceosorus guamensis TaxID=1522189 RepID=A0A316W597_9BASI|nr:hypothetical protein IE81DRAFT_345480 [Ceraceosorus guamensis]PWN44794.1 hypothetical protein IE81DRAFT_345480 [Ceraceosorus guamensis]
MTFASPMLGLSAGLTQGLANFLCADGKLIVPKSSRAQAQGTQRSLDGLASLPDKEPVDFAHPGPLTARPLLESRNTVRPSTARSSEATPTLQSSKQFALAPHDQSEGQRIPLAEPANLPFPAAVPEAQPGRKRDRKSKAPRRPAKLGEGSIPARTTSLSNPPSPSNSRSRSEAGSSRTLSDASFTGSEYSARSLGVGEHSVDSVESASRSGSANLPSPKAKRFADRIRSRVSSLASVRSRRQSSKSASEHDGLSEQKSAQPPVRLL